MAPEHLSIAPFSPHLQITALSDHVLRAIGPTLLFTQPIGHRMPVLSNLFGVPDLRGVRAGGELLAR